MMIFFLLQPSKSALILTSHLFFLNCHFINYQLTFSSFFDRLDHISHVLQLKSRYFQRPICFFQLQRVKQNTILRKRWTFSSIPTWTLFLLVSEYSNRWKLIKGSNQTNENYRNLFAQTWPSQINSYTILLSPLHIKNKISQKAENHPTKTCGIVYMFKIRICIRI